MFFSLVDPLGGNLQPGADRWYQPALFYLIALSVRVLPFTEWVIRLPMALIGGLITPLLMYVLASRLCGRPWPALVAAAIVALSPTHLVVSRQALDYALPLPFVIGWLVCLHAYVETRRPALIAAAGLILGAGCYSYLPSWAMMPAYLVITWVVVIALRGGVRPIVLSATAFLLPIGVAAAWTAIHPQMLTQTVARYAVTETSKAGFLPTYLSMFNPTLLFVRGGPSLTTSTARSGFVLLPVALLLVAGVPEFLRRRDVISAVMIVAIVLAPLPAAATGQPGSIQRALYLLPFLAILGGWGVAALWRSRLGRGAAIVAVAGMCVQFGYFYFDYFTHYKLRSAFYYDPVAFGDVARFLFNHRDAPAYYFTDDLDDAIAKWRYYAIANKRDDLLPRARFIGRNGQPAAPAGSWLVTYDDRHRLDALQSAGWIIEHVVHDVDSRPAAVILRRASGE